MNFFDVTIIGVGRLGGALALALSEKGYQICALVSRNKENAEKIAQLITPKPNVLSEKEFEKINSNIVFISTQDSEIINVANELKEKLEDLPFVFHTSGSRSSKILSGLNDEGFEVASFHPLVSFSDPIAGVKNFKDSYICIEGDSQAVSIARQMALDLGGKPFSITPENKLLYHASAVTACGHLVALLSVAVEMLTQCGLEMQQAKEILLPLVKSTINNLSNQTFGDALTGTFARGDVETLKAHLEILTKSVSQDVLDIYLLLGKKSLELAGQNGVEPTRLQVMNDLLEDTFKLKTSPT